MKAWGRCTKAEDENGSDFLASNHVQECIHISRGNVSIKKVRRKGERIYKYKSRCGMVIKYNKRTLNVPLNCALTKQVSLRQSQLKNQAIQHSLSFYVTKICYFIRAVFTVQIHWKYLAQTSAPLDYNFSKYWS